MPKQAKFTREAVIDAGLEQLKEGGWESIKPRWVAKKLGASTMPIFSHFKNMEAFKTAILDRSWELMAAYASRRYTGDTWVDQAIGYVLFARDHGLLFNCMHYGNVEEIRERRMRFWEIASKRLEGYSTFEGLNAEHVGWIRHLRALLAHGIAVSISSGFVPLWEDEDVVREMLSLCSEILFEGLSANRDKLDEMTKKISPEAKKKMQGIRDGISGNESSVDGQSP